MNDQIPGDIEVFNAALEIEDAKQRQLYLDQACAGNRELHLSVQALLESFERGVQTFEPLAPNRSRGSSVAELAIGQQVGPYQIVEKIGEGGCGVVYIAEQLSPVRRKVAVKVIKAGMDTRSVIARFEAERQALAMMDHPNIAKVLDAGSTGQGRPYFAMEFVEGEKITAFCQQRNVSLPERLRLFTQVCDAVQHAHQKGVIHRDLKPSNILVPVSTAGPSPRIIDFGIAKAISGKLTSVTNLTGLDQFLGTPAYMSPEQALITTEDVDTRTDIYSLGVLLYELLTGQPPYDNRALLAGGLDEMRRIIREVEPRKPSEIAGSLSRELDWIVLKCLEKDRSRRYATANGLAADIQRYLNREPVVACPPTTAYKFKKYVQRNQVQFASAVVVLLALLGGTTVSTWQAVRASKAEREAAQVVDLLVKHIAEADLLNMEKPDPRSQFLVEKLSSKLDSSFAAHPLAEARIRIGIAMVMWSQHPTNQLFHLERAFHLRQQELGLIHLDTQQAASLLSMLYTGLYRFEDGDAVLRRFSSFIESSPDSLGTGYLLFAQGFFFSKQGNGDLAIPVLQRAISIFRKHPEAQYVEGADIVLGFSLAETKSFAEAEQFLKELVSASEARAPESYRTLSAWKALAYYYLQQQKGDLALPILERISPLHHAGLGEASRSVLDVDYMLGWAYELENRTNDAVRVYSTLTPHWPGVAPWYQDRCHEIAEWFLTLGEMEKARAAFDSLRKSYEIAPPTKADDFLHYLRAVAISKGWDAAAELCKGSQFNDSIRVCLHKAWIACFSGDQRTYENIVRNALGMARKLGTQEDHLPIEIAALGDARLSAAEKEDLKAQVAQLKPQLAGRERDNHFRACRAIAHLQLRFEEHGAVLASLSEVESLQRQPDAYALFLKAACLLRLNKRAEAEQAFADGEKAMHPEGLAALESKLPFLSPGERFQKLGMHRDVSAMFRASNH